MKDSPMPMSGFWAFKCGVRVHVLILNEGVLHWPFVHELVEGGRRGRWDDDGFLICQQAVLPSVEQCITARRPHESVEQSPVYRILECNERANLEFYL
jgi:hypothetical protein